MNRSRRFLVLALLIAAPAIAQEWTYQPCPFAGSPVYPGLPGVCHPYPQPWPAPSTQTTTGCPGKDCKTVVTTGAGIFPPSNPFNYLTFPGTNFLPTVYTNAFDSCGNEIKNTLPSTPDVPYNLHDGNPVVSLINPTSPEDDLKFLFDRVLRMSAGNTETCGAPPHFAGDAIKADLRLIKDILEGNPVANRVWSGMPLLHYNGPDKVKSVVPVYAASNTITGGNVDVHQVWYDQRIESDTAFIDTSTIPPNTAFTFTYTVDVLNRGRDDFSPFVMYLDGPTGKPGIGMDQTFFDMEEGTRTVFRIKMASPNYFNLVYTWGWRMHPPRAQVMEHASKTISYCKSVPCTNPCQNGWPCSQPACSTPAPPGCPAEYQGKTLPEIEQAVFCKTSPCSPTANDASKQYAIAKIGDLAPEKRMWNAVGQALKAADLCDWKTVTSIVRDKAQPAYFDWLNRNQLPAGVPKDPNSDLTLLFVNNSTYGELTNGAWGRWDEWQIRPKTLKVTVYNGDNFVHSYTIADFGGNRGWENQFKSSVKVAGSGCWFTFGRTWWSMPVGGPANSYICVPPATGTTPGVHRVEVGLNFEPSRRLRFYQFDPFHHDVAIYSVH